MNQYLQTIALKDVKCFALHGWYPEEQLTGCWFTVHITTRFMPQGDADDFQKTVNYEVLNQIILREMKSTQRLLETVVKNILDGVLSEYPFIQTADVSIHKQHPPMEGEVGLAIVSLQYNRKDGIS